MPLLKLWNTLLGRSTKPAVEQPAASQPQPPTVQPAKAAPPQSATKSSRSSGFGLFGGGPHGALCKLLKSVPANSVLEISVDDGSRAIAILQTLAKTQPAVRYFAIDQFELAGGPISLKQFHQRLRADGIRPQVFPETIERGLTRFAHTVGAADLIVIGAPVDQWQRPATVALLSRVSHGATVVLYRDGESWRPFQVTNAQLRRAG